MDNLNKKRCTSCDRFPFCDYQEKCTYSKDSLIDNCIDYWIKRGEKCLKSI